MRPQFFHGRLIRSLRLAGAWSLLFFLLQTLGQSALGKSSAPDVSNETKTMPVQVRWGKLGEKSEAMPLVTTLSEIFEKKSQQLNFSKRDLINLVEQGNPDNFSHIFPFRLARKIPENLFFENFGRYGFLVGEIDPNVPPLLASTDTIDWLEFRGPEHIELARELIPPLASGQGLRALSLQNPWLSEIFSTTWSQTFEFAGQIIENGGFRCWNKSTPKKLYQDLAEPSPKSSCSIPLTHLAQENILPKQLPKKIGNANALLNSTPAALDKPPPPTQAPNCVPMGRLNTQSLELIGDEKSGHCFLWRNALDERFLRKGVQSKLICLNSRYKTFQRTRFNSVVAVLPSSRPDSVHLLESEDGLMSAHRLNLATLSVAKGEVTSPSGQNSREFALPRQRNGLYACRQNPPPQTTPFSTLEVLGPSVDWIYVDEAVYNGMRIPRPETDAAWRVRENFSGGLEVERLNWSQLQYDHPSITNDRPFACIAGREIDAKCGLRIIQTAVQLSEEWLNNDFDKSEIPPVVQLTISVLMAQSLEKTLLALPEWSLRPETEELLNVFSQKIKQLIDGKLAGQVGLTLDRHPRKRPATQRYLDFPFETPEHVAIKKLLSYPNDFWAQLKQKSL